MKLIHPPKRRKPSPRIPRWLPKWMRRHANRACKCREAHVEPVGQIAARVHEHGRRIGFFRPTGCAPHKVPIRGGRLMEAWLMGYWEGQEQREAIKR